MEQGWVVASNAVDTYRFRRIAGAVEIKVGGLVVGGSVGRRWGRLRVASGIRGAWGGQGEPVEVVVPVGAKAHLPTHTALPPHHRPATVPRDVLQPDPMPWPLEHA